MTTPTTGAPASPGRADTRSTSLRRSGCGCHRRRYRVVRRGQRPLGLRRPGADAGSAVVEFSLVSVLLLMLLLAVLQVAVYLYVRNIAAASAAEGARYGANADVSAEDGAARARELLARGAGERTAGDLRCVGADESGPAGVRVSTVRCNGALPVFFAPLGKVLPLRVSARSIEEAPREEGSAEEAPQEEGSAEEAPPEGPVEDPPGGALPGEEPSG